MSLTITNAKYRSGMEAYVENAVSLVSLSAGNSSFNVTYKDSNGDYIFDRLFSAIDQTITNATSLDVDLYDLGTLDIGNGPGRDSVGLAHANSKIISMTIGNTSASLGTLTVDTSVANGWTAWMTSGTTVLLPGDSISGIWQAGLTVTDATNHLLRLSASVDDVIFDLQFTSLQ